MVFWLVNLAGLAAAYLLGSTPTAYWAGRMLKGIDIREHGSGSVGATNALRTLGKGPGLVVLLVDVLKGVAAIVFIRGLLAWLYALPSVAAPAGLSPEICTPWVVCLAGLAVVAGHSRSIWLRFTGGKSAATGLGVLLAISWPVGLAAGAAFVAVLAISRIASLSSILAALVALALVFSLEQPIAYRLLVVTGAAYVIARHRTNIQRLLAGTEPRVGQGSAGSKAQG